MNTTRRPTSAVADSIRRCEPACDPDDAEQRQRDRGAGRRSRIRESEDDERDEHGGEQAADEPRACLRAPRPTQREHEPDVAAEDERAEPPRDHVELVERQEAADEREREQPPAAEPDEAERRPAAARRRRGCATRKALTGRRRTAADDAANSSSASRRSAVAEVGPERLREDELGVRRLPQQEVREPLLARRPDEEVDLGQLRRREARGERLVVDVAGTRPSSTSRRAASTSSARPP